MADFVSHHLFGRQALTVFPAPAQRAAACRPACFFWGCQGPDPLFYRKILLGSPLHKLGNRMHSEKTDELFAALSRAVRDLSGDAQEIAAAYFYGFVCHYALDSEIHPYVYCRQAQFCTENPKLSASAVHSRIESDIDYLLYERACHRPITEFDPEERYQLSPVEQAVLSVVLHAVLKTVYGADVSTHELRRSFTEMTSWESFLYSESRAVYRGAKKAEAPARSGRPAHRSHEARAPDVGCAQSGSSAVA